MIKFIQNAGEFYSAAFFNEAFTKNVIDKSGYTPEALGEFNSRISKLKETYFKYKKEYLDLRRPKDKILKTHEFHTEVLRALGYDMENDPYTEIVLLKNDEGIPVRSKFYKNDKPHLYVMEMQSLIESGDEVVQGLFEQRYFKEQWELVFNFTDPYKLRPSVINDAISELFLIDVERRPEYVLLLAGSEIFLMHGEKWLKGGYLQFSLEYLFNESTGNRNIYSVFYILLSKEFLIPGTGSLILKELDEDSHKVAYAVTKDLKDGVVNAIEALANEAVYYLKSNAGQLELNNELAGRLKDDCLVYVYRLLFLFYAESREELEILPLKDDLYRKGYSLEMLRDLELVKLRSASSRDGYFFHDSLTRLFSLLARGFMQEWAGSKDYNGLSIRQVDSPLFEDRKLHILNKVKFRNFVLQGIIQQLSLSQKGAKKKRGRISYANLGINQLGSVYEGLLSYRGFFAEADYIEVKSASDKNGTGEKFLVKRSRRGDFTAEEVVMDPEEPGREKIIPKGYFVYRLNGVDRKKSASYYTPEILTQTTVKYTLKQILEKIESGKMKPDELLSMKILEPAMGASAFLNEVINQIALAYLEYKQKEKGERIKPSVYREELQRVKAYIATRNIYGVDINPTAVELGKLSLWLNVIFKNMETPFFGARLGVGNAVLGAWRKVYSRKDVIREVRPGNNKPEKKEWWNKPPRALGWEKNRNKRKDDEIYHFLLPDKNMFSSANIDILRSEYKNEAASVAKKKQKFCEPLLEHEVDKLLRISEVIDELFEEHYRQQTEISRRTYSAITVYGQKDEGRDELFNYYSKEEASGRRENSGEPYYKLKMIMDYWCSLWFWDVRDAAQLPSREEFITDIINILKVDLSKVPLANRLPHQGETARNLFGPVPEQLVIKFPPGTSESGDVYKSDEEKHKFAGWIDENTESTGMFKDTRKSLIAVYAAKYRFFHYELEFIEVFKERGGFDIIAGNPPWVKLLFEERDIISDDYPEIMIRKFTAPELKPFIQKALQKSNFLNTYLDARIEAEAYSDFANGVQNYPFLIGQMPNLYKLVLANSFELLSQTGYLGLVHPETVYDDPNGAYFRKAIYQRLVYHFQFLNELFLFAEVGHRLAFGINVYKGQLGEIDFYSMNNLFHPATIDGSFQHDGYGFCGGFKILDPVTGQFTWNRQPHRDRVLHFREEELRLLSTVFENGATPSSSKLVNLQSEELIKIVHKLTELQYRVESFSTIITVGFNETIDFKNNTISKSTDLPDIDDYELILSGPHTSVANPLNKASRIKCDNKADYDVIDLMLISDDFIQRNKYKPAKSIAEFLLTASNISDTESTAKEIKKSWLDLYKLSFSRMLNTSSERTLQPAILHPKSSHIYSLISVMFENNTQLVELACLSSSVLFDFLVKTMGSDNFISSRIKNLPIGILGILLDQGFARILRLNCLNKNYKDLWEQFFNETWKQQTWSSPDTRLTTFHDLENQWTWNTPLRNPFERRMALVEIDVIVALEVGLTLEQLITIYLTTFSLMQQYEAETYYDQKGRIVFTVNNALNGVGLERKKWETVKDNKEGELVKDTIKYELHRGVEITYHPPFEKCNRVEDYKTAWGHFEKIKNGIGNVNS